MTWTPELTRLFAPRKVEKVDRRAKYVVPGVRPFKIKGDRKFDKKCEGKSKKREILEIHVHYVIAFTRFTKQGGEKNDGKQKKNKKKIVKEQLDTHILRACV